jgi:drug/metabolite transporter (DMT)-like permease
MQNDRRIDHRAGIGFAAATAVISGVAVWVNAFGVQQVPDAILYTTLKNGVAAAALAGILLAAARARPRPGSLPVTRPSAASLVAVLVVGMLGGGLAFVLFFSGLAQATAAGAAFIQKTLFIWVAVLAVPMLGERLGLAQIAALGALLAGQALIAPPRALGWGSGEWMILGATLIWAGEVILARRLLATVPPLTLGVARLGIGLIVLVGAVVVGGRLGGLAAISAQGWAVIGLTGLLLAAYVGTWFEALRRAPASLVTSILVGGALVTAALQAAAAGRVPEFATVAGGALLLAGVVTVAWLAARRHPVPAAATEPAA